MRGRSFTNVLVLFVVAAAMVACRTRPAALASSTTPVKPGSYVVLGDAQGSAWGAMLFVIPLYGPMAQGARDAAIAQFEGADGLINVSMDYTIFYLPLVTLTRATVRGEAIARLR